MNASVELAERVRRHSSARRRELRDLLTAHTATVEELVAAARGPRRHRRRARRGGSARTRTRITCTSRKVDMGTGELLDVVCGAPNVHGGQAVSVRARRAPCCPAASRSRSERFAGRRPTACSARRASSGSARITTASWSSTRRRAGHAVPRGDAGRRHAPRDRRAAQPSRPAVAPRPRARDRRGDRAPTSHLPDIGVDGIEHPGAEALPPRRQRGRHRAAPGGRDGSRRATWASSSAA